MRLRIDKAIYGGAGLARMTEGEQAGKAVFVPFTLPGELAEVRVRAAKKGFAEAELVQVVETSSDRIEAKCRHFGVCGGCQYQHAAYEAQLTMKRGILLETMARAGLAGLPDVVVHASEAWGYRNRIRLRVEYGAVGYNRRGSNVFLPVVECPIAGPLVWRAAEALRDVGGEALRDVAEVEVFANGSEDALLMTLMMRHRMSDAELAKVCEALQVRVPELRGAGAVMATEARGGRGATLDEDAAGGRVVAQWGDGGLSYEVAGRTYAVSRGAFFQVNRFLVDELVRLVADPRAGKLALDLYAGVGLFTAALAERFAKVVAVEVGAESSGDLRQRVERLGVSHRAVKEDTASFLRRQKDVPELVIVDPPRAGLGPDVCERLGALGASEMVYVSCDPATMARDLKMLLDSGYTIAELHLFDLFPQTFHLETVAVLRR